MRILAVFDLTKARDPSTGAVVEFEPEFASGMIRSVVTVYLDARRVADTPGDVAMWKCFRCRYAYEVREQSSW